MKRQLQGIALILFSILLNISFELMGIRAVFDLSLHWSVILTAIGVVGLFLVFTEPKNKDK